MLKLYKYLKPFTLSIVFIFVLVFFQTLTDLYLPTLMSDIIDKGVMKGNTDVILEIGLYMLLITALGVISAIIANFLSSKTGTGFSKIIRSKLFNKVESFSLKEFDKFGTSTLITRNTNDVTQVQMVTITIFRMLIMAPMMLVGGIIMALRKEASLTWVLGVTIPFLILIIGVVAIKAIPTFKKIQLKIDKLNLIMRENLTGIRVIRAFNKSDYEKNRFEDANRDLTNTYIKVNRLMAFLMPSIMFIMNITSLMIMWFGAKKIDLGEMQIGSMIAFTQYAMQIMMSLIMATMLFVLIPRAQASANRINEVLNTEVDMKDGEENNLLKNKNNVVEFKNVTFRYPGAEEPALKNINFKSYPGEITAIIGSTGSGKSTLVNLIPRFYDIESGEITIDGINIASLKQSQLRDKIGFVPQNPSLFSGTIIDNLKVGNDKATLDEIKKAIEIAQAKDFVEDMDGNYEHEIAQGGRNVSGGQKQRLSIARAIVRNPEIYVFDDSFSALDYKTDSNLRKALREEIKNSSIFIVSQRVSTIKNADRILVLDNGEIVGNGKHDELLESCTVYREIVSSQI